MSKSKSSERPNAATPDTKEAAMTAMPFTTKKAAAKEEREEGVGEAHAGHHDDDSAGQEDGRALAAAEAGQRLHPLLQGRRPHRQGARRGDRRVQGESTTALTSRSVH